MINYRHLMTAIDYNFKQKQLLKLALTHSSYAKERGQSVNHYNERLEFLGDSILGLVISEYLYKHYAELPEGKLTKYRSIIVCEPTLASIAKTINLGEFILFSRGEEATGGRTRPSILADCLEAIIAAIYLDGGMEKVKQFILTFFAKKIEDTINGRIFLDYKTALQEKVQAKLQLPVRYKIVAERGPDHLKEFISEVYIGGQVKGRGLGKSKKEAEQQAAMEAIQEFMQNEDRA